MVAVVIVVWVAGGTLSVLHARHPAAFALHSAAAPAVLQTIAAGGALLLCVLCYGRWRQRGLVRDLGTTAAFALLGLGGVIFSLVPLLVTSISFGVGFSGGKLLVAAVGGLVLAVSSLLPGWARGRSGTPSYLVFLAVVMAAATALALVLARAAGGFLALGDPGMTGDGSGGPAVAVTLQVTIAIAFGVASLGFIHRAVRVNDTFYAWLAVTAALWSLARVSFAFTPPHVAESVTIGDWLRLSAYCVALLAATTEITGYWQRLAETAVLEERRRIARELHDGLSQELAYISAQGRSVAAELSDPRVGLLARAGERALDESRRAIAALTRPLDEPLDIALAQTAEELGGRMGVRVLLDLESGVAVNNDVREALLRIAREAITNAGRHGRPSKIAVSMSNANGVSLRVADDGRGFRVDDPVVYAGGRYGVAGMRERVEALGGRFSVESRPYGGTRVEVWVP